MKVALILKDIIFSRMLELELEARGISVDMLQSYEKAAKMPLNYIFVDEKNYNRETKVFSSCEVIIICDRTDSIQRDYDFPHYARPFNIKKMLDDTLGRLSDSYEGANNAKRTSEGMRLHSDTHSVAFRGERIHLSKKEYQLLKMLIDKNGDVVSREEAYPIFSDEEGCKTNVVDVYINYLRKKLDSHFGIKIIQSVRGKGYSISQNT